MVYEMMVGATVPQADGSWNVSFAPDNDTWITVLPEQVDGIAPMVGDVLSVKAPEVIGIVKSADIGKVLEKCSEPTSCQEVK